MSELTPYQKRLFRLLYKPNAGLVFFFDGHHPQYMIRYKVDDQEVIHRVTENTFRALLEHCEIVYRDKSYTTFAKPRDLVTDEDRQRMKIYEELQQADKENLRPLSGLLKRRPH
jgi:hypothetical protein